MGLLALSALLGSGAARADTLVSNLGQPLHETTEVNAGVVVAQGFYTGGIGSRFNLTSVQLPMSGPEVNPISWSSVTVTIREPDARGFPGDVVHTLTSPSGNVPASRTTISFEAPRGVTLAPDTEYFVHIANSENKHLYIDYTTSTQEDSGSADEWTLWVSRRLSVNDWTTWFSHWSDEQVGPVKMAVNGSLQGPSIENVAVVSTPIDAARGYGVGEIIEIDVEFSRHVWVTGNVLCTIRIGSVNWWRGARYHIGSGTNTLTFRYTVRATDFAPDGIRTGGNFLGNASQGVQGGGTIRDVFGADARLPHRGIPNNLPAHKVDGTRPGAPRNLMASSEDAAVTLSWEVPESIGGSPITAYRYRYKTDGDYGDWIEIAGSANARSHRITRLAATPHTFQLAAVNNSGQGHSSTEVIRTPLVDTRPPRLEAQSVDGSRVTLDFDEDIHEESGVWPLSHTGVSVKVGGTLRALNATVEVGTDPSIVVLTLVSAVAAGDEVTVSYSPPTRPPDTNYPLRDWAGNEVAAFTDVPVRNVLGDQPTAPTDLAVAPSGTAKLTLSWTAPDDGNSVLLRYEYLQRKGNEAFGTTWVEIPDSAGLTSHEFTGLDLYTEYGFKLRAVNGFGTGPESEEATGLTGTVPATPTGLMVAPSGYVHHPSSAKLTLSWTAPDAGGIELLRYEYLQRKGNEAFGTTWTEIPDSAGLTSHAFTGLDLDTEYGFKLRAVNGAGDGPESTEATGRTLGKITFNLVDMAEEERRVGESDGPVGVTVEMWMPPEATAPHDRALYVNVSARSVTTTGADFEFQSQSQRVALRARRFHGGKRALRRAQDGRVSARR